jgi:hypothetical protein
MATIPRDKNATNVPDLKATAEYGAVRAAEEWLGGYYVLEYTACSWPDLTETSADTWGFINNCASWQKKNYVYADGDVWADDFRTSSDHYAAGHLPAGFDGIDSVVVGYISAHGQRINASTVRLIMGGTGHGGCTVNSNQMSLGENDLRYLFLSTCESVSTSPGNTWFGPANGIRAILGYDTLSVDSPDYGKFFFENWKKPRAKTSDSFLDASWRISHEQTPVAAFFGPDRSTAQNLLDNEEYFQHDAISSNSIAWAWYDARSLRKGIDVPNVRMMTLHYTDPSEPPAAAELVARLALRSEAVAIDTTTVSGDNVCYSTDDGSMLAYNTRSGSIDLTLGTFASSDAVLFTDDEAVADATAYLSGLQDALPSLTTEADDASIALSPYEIRHTLAASADRSGGGTDEKLTHVTVVFRQMVAGIPTVGTGGVVEVTLNGAREVCRVRSVLREIASVTSGDSTFDLATLLARAEERALAEILGRRFVTGARVVKSEFGFYAADEGVSQRTAEPTFRVLVEMQSQEVAKLIEKLYRFEELADEA